jgi:hypothetical protein
MVHPIGHSLPWGIEIIACNMGRAVCWAFMAALLGVAILGEAVQAGT